MAQEIIVSLRKEIGLAIVKAFNRTHEKHNINFDPDTCYEAADEVIAVLMSRLTGQHFEAKFHPSIIEPAQFISDGEIYE